MANGAAIGQGREVKESCWLQWMLDQTFVRTVKFHSLLFLYLWLLRAALFIFFFLLSFSLFLSFFLFFFINGRAFLSFSPPCSLSYGKDDLFWIQLSRGKLQLKGVLHPFELCSSVDRTDEPNVNGADGAVFNAQLTRSTLWWIKNKAGIPMEVHIGYLGFCDSQNTLVSEQIVFFFFSHKIKSPASKEWLGGIWRKRICDWVRRV